MSEGVGLNGVGWVDAYFILFWGGLKFQSLLFTPFVQFALDYVLIIVVNFMVLISYQLIQYCIDCIVHHRHPRPDGGGGGGCQPCPPGGGKLYGPDPGGIGGGGGGPGGICWNGGGKLEKLCGGGGGHVPW